eukprot:1152453-Pelagomonas_calceolata.AAC.3
MGQCGPSSTGKQHSRAAGAGLISPGRNSEVCVFTLRQAIASTCVVCKSVGPAAERCCLREVSCTIQTPEYEIFFCVINGGTIARADAQSRRCKFPQVLAHLLRCKHTPK